MALTQQFDLLESSEIWRETILCKLRGLDETNQFFNFERCGHDVIYKTCRACGSTDKLTYRCNLKWCPACNWRITRERAETLRRWHRYTRQAKHLVLTQRNQAVLTSRTLKHHVKNLARLRKQLPFKPCRGGCISIEITNEGQGWHIHSHWLIDIPWLDMAEVSKRWGKLVGQDYAIVKVKDAREQDYAHEVCKYVVKGSELASWPGEEIHQFVRVIRGRRFFITFGSLSKLRKQIRAELDNEKPPSTPCSCGACCFKFRPESTEEKYGLEKPRRKKRYD